MTTRRTSVFISAVVFIMTLSTLAAQRPNDEQLLRVRETVNEPEFAGDTRTVETWYRPKPSSSAAASKSGKGKPIFFEHRRVSCQGRKTRTAGISTHGSSALCRCRHYLEQLRRRNGS